jgi:hypothetical protein
MVEVAAESDAGSGCQHCLLHTVQAGSLLDSAAKGSNPVKGYEHSAQQHASH